MQDGDNWVTCKGWGDRMEERIYGNFLYFFLYKSKTGLELCTWNLLINATQINSIKRKKNKTFLKIKSIITRTR